MTLPLIVAGITLIYLGLFSLGMVWLSWRVRRKDGRRLAKQWAHDRRSARHAGPGLLAGSQMTRVLCPACGGEGRIRAIICGTRDLTDFPSCGLHWLPCSLCAGNGEIEASQLKRLKEGERMRADRVRRRVSLREEAARLGISPPELSKRENGRA